MPRLPVDGVKVQELRITLGTKERQILESAKTAYSFRNISTPIVTAINDDTTLLLLAGILGISLSQILPEEWEEVTAEMTTDQIWDWLEIQNLAGAFAGARLGARGGWVGSLIGAVLGAAGIETAEDFVEEVQQGITIPSGIVDAADDRAGNATIGVVAVTIAFTGWLRRLVREGGEILSPD
jgi:hypothetical protein